MKYILTINPGSTSTKIALFEGLEEKFTTTIRYEMSDIAMYKSVMDQYDFREKSVVSALEKKGVALSDIAIVVGRGGLLRPVSSGVYRVNEAMIEDLSKSSFGEHASNLGAVIADAIAKKVCALNGENSCMAVIADPVVVDELAEVVRVMGHPKFKRRSIFHALNQKAIAKQYAQDVGKDYASLNLIVAHLGGGVSVGLHSNGRVVDVNNALDGDGPFSPERSGSLPALDVAKLCFSGEYSFDQIKKMIVGESGTVSMLGTNAFYEIRKRIEAGDLKAKAVADAFIYNIAKTIGSYAPVVKGKVDAILITGGIANGTELMKQIEAMVDWIAPVRIYPGEDEMRALAQNGYNVLTGKEQCSEY